jgi:hypothetical protein
VGRGWKLRTLGKRFRVMQEVTHQLRFKEVRK